MKNVLCFESFFCYYLLCNSKMGEIAKLLSEAEEDDSPLEKKLDR